MNLADISGRLVPWRVKNFIRTRVTPRFRYPLRITLSDFEAAQCVFEVTTRTEELRVRSLAGEKEFISLILNELQPGDNFFDIGSCLGMVALPAAMKGAKVWAFEPDPNHFERLLRNIKINRLSERIETIDWAVSDGPGRAELFTDGIDGSSPSLREIGSRGSVQVQLDSLDNAIANGKLPNPDVLKLDIEGAEILAIRGMRGLLHSNHAPRTLFVEVHPHFLPNFHATAEDCLSILRAAGYVDTYSQVRANETHFAFRRQERE